MLLDKNLDKTLLYSNLKKEHIRLMANKVYLAFKSPTLGTISCWIQSCLITTQKLTSTKAIGNSAIGGTKSYFSNEMFKSLRVLQTEHIHLYKYII